MQYFDRVWKPWKWVRSFGPFFVCMIGIASVYIGQVIIVLAPIISFYHALS